MRMTRLFSQTLREAPGDAEVTSHQLLVRAGFIRQLGAGIFSYLPLARRSLTKIENIMREEMNRIGGQEVTMPVVHPADLWQATGRWYQIGSEMGRFKDKTDHDMVLAMTHEEVVADLARSIVRSYRQLPALIYHIQTKWRDDPRPRAGLIRVREFTMLDSYSLDADSDGLARQYDAHYQAYFRIFDRCGLPVIAVKSDTGMMGGKLAHEYMYLTDIGEDTLILCDGMPGSAGHGCGYTANRQVAAFRKPAPPAEAPLPIEKVATPHTTTIADLAVFLGVPEAKTAKAVFLMAELSHPNLPRLQEGMPAEQVRVRRDPRRHGGERDEAGERRAGQGVATGDRGGDSSRGRDAGLCVARGPARRAGGRGRPDPAIAQPGGGRKRGRLPPAERQLRPGLLRRDRVRHRSREGWRCLRAVRQSLAHRARRRSRQHLPARHTLHRGARRDLPGSRREASARRHGLVRHRRGAAAGLHRRRRITTTRGSSGR